MLMKKEKYEADYTSIQMEIILDENKDTIYSNSPLENIISPTNTKTIGTHVKPIQEEAEYIFDINTIKALTKEDQEESDSFITVSDSVE